MRRKLTILAVWFLLTMIVLVLNISLLSAYQKGKTLSLSVPNDFLILPTHSITTPTSTGTISDVKISGEDARAIILENFIRRYKPSSPFLPYTQNLVHEADAYNLDFRLLPAIAMCESSLGLRIPSSDSFNAWGIAVYTRDNKGKHFENWEQAISWVAKYMKEKYYDRGITDLYDIGAIWAPPSITNEYSWTRCVQGFMDKME
jgi:hypothetical protein